MNLLEVSHLNKTYTSHFGTNKVEALKDVNFTVKPGEFIAIMGESGSGKTTLLNILSSLDKPTSGEVRLLDKDITKIAEKDIASFRRNNLGFIFQDFNLLETFSNEDNIFLPLVLSNHQYDDMENRLEELAKKLNIVDILKKYPYEISGGQQQRVATARALITFPQIVFADEPTGALDSKSSLNLLALLEETNSQGQTILMVTHSTITASYASRILFIKDGIIYHQIYKGDTQRKDFHQKILDTLTVINSGGSQGE